MKYQILHGDNRETLKTLPDNSIDAIVTDPPYGIDFLGKAWDANTGAVETYQECLRVLKPGGHILAFSAARTYHHLAVTLEQAGFEIRDQIMWIYSSGFPKSQDVGKSIERAQGKRLKLPSDNGSAIVGMGTQCSKCGKKENGSNQYKCSEDPCPLQEVLKPADNEWAGWGTNLKPAHEPIALARKPLHKNLSIAKNCQEWGVGALNIDATRIAYAEDDTLEEWKQRYPDVANDTTETHANFNPELQGKKKKKSDKEKIMDWANKYTSPGMQEYAKLDGTTERTHTEEQYKSTASPLGRFPSNVIGEIAEPYQKYFYCPKVGRKERHIEDAVENNHPTVKPIELMKYLIRLITPAGGTVLDPFNGSGSTGCAAVELGHAYIGCELDPAYVEIAHRRIQAWSEACNPTLFHQLFSTD